jgi:hypothetical protein
MRFKIPTARHLFGGCTPLREGMFVFVFLSAILAQGCSGLNEAYRDRFSQQNPTIRFGCNQGTRAPVGDPSPKSDFWIFVRGAPDPDPPVVGELFDWNTSNRIPVVIIGPPPNEVLAADVKAILTRNGFNVTEDHQTAQAFLDVDITQLGTWGIPGGWTELRGTTVAQIDFFIQVSRGGEVIWKRDFSETEKIRVLYFLTSDMEEAMKQAYCRSLESIENVVKEPEFLAVISK